MNYVKRIATTAMVLGALGAAAQEKPSLHQATPGAAIPSTEPNANQRSLDQMERVLNAQRSAVDAQRLAQQYQIAKGGGGFGGAGRMNDAFVFALGSPSDSPVLLVTAPMDDKVRGEWKEDLAIMNKLLENAVQNAGDNGVSQAMGIQLQTTGKIAPIYMEDCGLIFRMSVNIPLAASGKFPTTKSTAPTSKPSAWELTKRQLSGRNEYIAYSDWQTLDLQGRALGASRPAFDQDKVDALIATLIAQLPEATHFRHLGAGEWIFVSISGSDDAGNPKRLTLKVNKSDIDDAASGKIKPDDFKRRVARSIN